MERMDLNLFEVWRPISGYNGLYDVSSEGRIWSYKTNKILKQHQNQKGYYRVRMDGKFFSVARLVCAAFNENPHPDTYNEVNHINEDKSDNTCDNLEWCDRKYNVNYGNRAQKQMETNIKNGRVNPKYIGASKNKEIRKLYREDHKDRINELKRQYHIRNREKDNERVRRWREQHPDYYKKYTQVNYGME